MMTQQTNSDIVNDSIVLVVKLGSQLIERKGGFYLKVKPLSERKVIGGYKLCVNENDINGNISAFSQGSGFFITSDVIATAAHVILDANDFINGDLDKIRFIKNFKNFEQSITRGEMFIPNENIFKAIHPTLMEGFFDYTSTNQDWALIKIDNETVNGEKRNKSSISICVDGVSEKDELTWIGHPLGLMKSKHEAEKIIKKSTKEDDFFETPHLAAPGNSGSPVLNRNEEVVGILIRSNGRLILDKEANCVQYVHIRSIFEGTECQDIRTVDTALTLLKSNSEFSA